MQHGVARFALEAPDVPLAVEGDQRLALLQLIVAAGALVGARHRARPQPHPRARARGAGGRRALVPWTHGDLHAAGAQHLLASVRHALARREGLAEQTM